MLDSLKMMILPSLLMHSFNINHVEQCRRNVLKLSAGR